MRRQAGASGLVAAWCLKLVPQRFFEQASPGSFGSCGWPVEFGDFGWRLINLRRERLAGETIGRKV